MLTPDKAYRQGQKYSERHGAITTAMIERHLARAIALAAPAVVGNRAHLLPLDMNIGSLRAIRALIAEAPHRLWFILQYCPRTGLANQDQRSYVLSKTRWARSLSETPLHLHTNTTIGMSPSRRPCAAAL
jgi:hypothetical protein